jgi:peptidoglycan/xylan/chitin deacetylase (PgdA/CDA1 family)
VARARVRAIAAIAFLIAAEWVTSVQASVATPRHSTRHTPAAPAWLAGTDGGVFTLGTAAFRGSLGATNQPQPVIALAARSSGRGYWITALDGNVWAFGDAPYRGSLGGVRLNQPIVDIAATPTGGGYWLVAADGGVFTFGDARFFGSLGSTRLNQPVSGMIATPSGAGYWLVAADGGVFAFGNARFFGSLGGARPAQPIATIAATPDGRGYWLLSRDGRVSRFGDATLFGDAAGAGALAVSLVPTKSGRGYWIASTDGRVRAFGDAAEMALPHISLRAPIAGMATPWASSSGVALPLLGLASMSAQRTWVGAREAALTFDDGPSAYTLPMLGVLTRRGVPATFFTVGSYAAAHRALLAAEAAAGMSVEVHDWDHVDLTRLSAPAIADELSRAAGAVQGATGRRPTCFRPPYGATNKTVVAEGTRLGLAQILWNVDPSDYRRPGAGTIAARVLATATGRGLVIGMHDGGGDRSQTVAALPTIIDGLRARGYTLVRLCA